MGGGGGGGQGVFVMGLVESAQTSVNQQKTLRMRKWDQETNLVKKACENSSDISCQGSRLYSDSLKSKSKPKETKKESK